MDAMACPGCGCLPGDGKTPGCKHPEGCGYLSKSCGVCGRQMPLWKPARICEPCTAWVTEIFIQWDEEREYEDPYASGPRDTARKLLLEDRL